MKALLGIINFQSSMSHPTHVPLEPFLVDLRNESIRIWSLRPEDKKNQVLASWKISRIDMQLLWRHFAVSKENKTKFNWADLFGLFLTQFKREKKAVSH
jgi:hypothetical protein